MQKSKVQIKNQKGFTVLELLVSATVLITIMTFVLANFRTGQYSGELDVVTRQIVDSVGTVRNMTLGGQVIEDPTSPGQRVFPAGGYGVHFDNISVDNAKRLVLYADGINSFSEKNSTYDSGEEITGGVINFENVTLIQLCGLDQTPIPSVPCDSDNWSILGNSLDVIFPVPGKTTATYTVTDSYDYVGGVFSHQETAKLSYFYVSLLSGLVSGGLIDD